MAWRRQDTPSIPFAWLETRPLASAVRPKLSGRSDSFALAGPDRPNLTQSPELSRRHFGVDAPGPGGPSRVIRETPFQRTRTQDDLCQRKTIERWLRSDGRSRA